MTPAQIIGEAIRAERIAQHLDPTTLGEISGTSPRTVLRTEAGISMNQTTLAALIDALAVEFRVELVVP